MPTKTSLPLPVPVTSNRAVPRAEDTGSQSAPVEMFSGSLVRANPDVLKVLVADIRYPSAVRCDPSAQSSAPPPNMSPRPGNSRSTPITRAMMRPGPQLLLLGGGGRTGGGLAAMANLLATAGTTGLRLAPADRTSLALLGTPRAGSAGGGGGPPPPPPPPPPAAAGAPPRRPR